jgi:hypothetical protein
MKADGTISKLETHRNQAKISRALLSEEDQAAFDQLNESVQKTLKGLGKAPGVVANVIPYLNIAVGLVVCCTMYALYSLSRKGDV